MRLQPLGHLSAFKINGVSDEVKNYITPGGYRRLQEELAHLWKVERPPIVTTVAWAAGNGDRSENGDYIYGKRKLREIDRRIRYLSKSLDRAVVVDNSGETHERVHFGATVTILYCQQCHTRASRLSKPQGDEDIVGEQGDQRVQIPGLVTNVD